MGAFLCVDLTRFRCVTEYKASSLQLLIDAVAVAVEATDDLVAVISHRKSSTQFVQQLVFVVVGVYPKAGPIVTRSNSCSY